MTATCKDPTSPRCALPTSGVEHICPLCNRVWLKIQRPGGWVWWFRGVWAKGRKP